ncbi:MAG: hypothetical protein R3E87_14965 [Burkholderiaceae bacterium]
MRFAVKLITKDALLHWAHGQWVRFFRWWRSPIGNPVPAHASPVNERDHEDQPDHTTQPELPPDKYRERTTTLSALLDSLESTFNETVAPLASMDGMTDELHCVARTIGIYIPDAFFYDRGYPMFDAIRFPCLDRLPTMLAFSVGLGPGTAERMFPTTIIAQKVKAPPLGYCALRGGRYIYFEVAVVWAWRDETGSVHSRGAAGVIGVNRDTRTIAFCRQRQAATIAVGEGHYRQQSVGASRLASLLRDGEGDPVARLTMFKIVLTQAFAWWNTRERAWSVSVKRIHTERSPRLIFSIAPENTKTFFKDRDKTVRAADGKAKRIIHYVNSHRRSTARSSTVVREHIRGIRSFDWHGYRCNVTAPRFNGRLANQFTIGASSVPSTLADDPEYVSVPAVASALVAIEEGRPLPEAMQRVVP